MCTNHYFWFSKGKMEERNRQAKTFLCRLFIDKLISSKLHSFLTPFLLMSKGEYYIKENCMYFICKGQYTYVLMYQCKWVIRNVMIYKKMNKIVMFWRQFCLVTPICFCYVWYHFGTANFPKCFCKFQRGIFLALWLDRCLDFFHLW